LLPGPDGPTGYRFGGDFQTKITGMRSVQFSNSMPIAAYSFALLRYTVRLVLENGEGRTRKKVAAMIRYLPASLALGAVAKGS
jgi:hypothetical protein